MTETITIGRVELTPFKVEDAYACTKTTRHEEGLAHLGDVETSYRLYEEHKGWTLRVEGEIVGCAGVIKQWKGHGMAWLIPSPFLPKYPKTVILAVVQQLRTLIQANDYKRISCTVEEDFAVGRRFVEWLGFEPEARMPFYGPKGETHIGYAWIRPDA